MIEGLGEDYRPLWWDTAQCRGIGPTVMWPDAHDRDAIVEALRVCVGCPAMDACHTAGLGQREGVWAGVLHTPRQRGKPRKGHPRSIADLQPAG